MSEICIFDHTIRLKIKQNRFIELTNLIFGAHTISYR